MIVNIHCKEIVIDIRCKKKSYCFPWSKIELNKKKKTENTNAIKGTTRLNHTINRLKSLLAITFLRNSLAHNNSNDFISKQWLVVWHKTTLWWWTEQKTKVDRQTCRNTGWFALIFCCFMLNKRLFEWCMFELLMLPWIYILGKNDKAY